MSESLKDRIIQKLIENHNISEKDVNEAISLKKRKGIGLEQALVEKDLVNEKELLLLLVKELNIPFINLKNYKIDPDLQSVIPEKTARQYHIIPLSCFDENLTIAIADPLNVFLIDDLKNITGLNIDIVMSTSADITKSIDNYYGFKALETVNDVSKDINVDDFAIVSDGDQGGDADGKSSEEGDQAPIIRMVNLILKDAIKQRASDIHIEPMQDNVRVRYRIDGILKNILEIPKDNQNAVVVRLKIMARLDITVNQAPQDGRFKLKVGSSEIDFRVSILPTTFGQKVVMRILDKSSLSVGLEGLGFSSGNLKIIKEAMHKPFGMILVTGPTGSGKSTTLYSIINELNDVDKNIITVEDPVEYLVDGLTQIQARPDIGLTFAEGLRSILRQSPDIVLVGEIRDDETADIAIKASLTGQLVFSTLHTNDAASALTRLIDMKAEPFLVASSLVMVTAQRLCRKICKDCKEEISINQKVLNRLQYSVKPTDKFFAGKGCESCNQLGYKGRTCVTEILMMDDDIRKLLLEGKSSDEIKEFARKNKGMLTLWEDAMQKCLEGMTTLEEVLRVTMNE